MNITNFRASDTLDIEVCTNVEVELYEIGYSVEDSDVQVQLRLDRDNLRVVADFIVSVKLVSDKDRSKFIVFKYEDSTSPYKIRTRHTRLTSRFIETHNLDDSEFESLFGGSIDDLGFINIKFE